MSNFLLLQRLTTGAQGTFGCLFDTADVALCWVVELPDRHNQPNHSCIPAGRYAVRYLPRSASGRYRNVYWLPAVPGRSGILIHPGNFAGDQAQGWRTDSWGCLLPALHLGLLAGQRAGLASRSALAHLHQHTGRRGFHLEIRE